MSPEIEKQARELLDKLWNKRNEDELEEYDRGVFETLQFLFEGTTVPDID